MVDLIDRVVGAMTYEQWDALRNWIATVGGLIAIFFAANTYRQSAKVKREEQARLTYSRIEATRWHNPGDNFSGLGAANRAIVEGSATWGGGRPTDRMTAIGHVAQVLVVVHNGSRELIGPVRVELVDQGQDRFLTMPHVKVREAKKMLSFDFADMEPDTEAAVEFVVSNPAYPSLFNFAPTILFRDASGRWWRRFRSEAIERVHDDPENNGTANVQRSLVRTGVVRRATIPMRIRWQRFWRAVRGKTPIP
jgi:hypothetical protein